MCHAQLLSSTMRTARTIRRKCWWCGEGFAKGERYEDQRLTYKGSAYQIVLHEECMDPSTALSNYDSWGCPIHEPGSGKRGQYQR